MPRKKSREKVDTRGRDDLESLLDRLELPAWICDRETLRVLAVNGPALEVYGYTREEFLRLGLREIQPEVPLHPSRLAGHARHRRRDGTEIEVEQAACPLEFCGRPAVVVLVRRTGTPASGEAADWEERFLQLAELIPDYAYAFRVEPDGRLQGEWLSRSFERVFGFTLEEIDPYRPAWSREEALAYIREQAGKLFDPRVVDAFLREIERGED